MGADRDTFLVAAYTQGDTFYRATVVLRLPPYHGPAPRRSDSTVLTLVVVGQWLGSSERARLTPGDRAGQCGPCRRAPPAVLAGPDGVGAGLAGNGHVAARNLGIWFNSWLGRPSPSPPPAPPDICVTRRRSGARRASSHSGNAATLTNTDGHRIMSAFILVAAAGPFASYRTEYRQRWS